MIAEREAAMESWLPNREKFMDIGKVFKKMGSESDSNITNGCQSGIMFLWEGLVYVK